MAEYVNRQALAREMQTKAKPLGGVDEAMQRNYELGIIAGMRLAVALPAQLVELEREAFNEKLNEERMNG